MRLRRAPTLALEANIRMNSGRRFAFGPGKAELLEHIDAAGSIRAAANAMGMSYMRAWQIVESLDSAFAEPLVIKSRGGRTNGGAVLSDTGREILRLYREMEAAAISACKNSSRSITGLLTP